MTMHTFAPSEAPTEYDQVGDLIHKSHIALDKAWATPRRRPLLRRRRIREAEAKIRIANYRARTYLDSLPRATPEDS